MSAHQQHQSNKGKYFVALIVEGPRRGISWKEDHAKTCHECIEALSHIEHRSEQHVGGRCVHTSVRILVTRL